MYVCGRSRPDSPERNELAKDSSWARRAGRSTSRAAPKAPRVTVLVMTGVVLALRGDGRAVAGQLAGERRKARRVRQRAGSAQRRRDRRIVPTASRARGYLLRFYTI